MTIDGTVTATGTETLAAIGGDRDRPVTGDLGGAMTMPTPTRRAEATEIASARTGTRVATGAIETGTATGVAAGTPGATMKTGLRGEIEISTMTDADLVTGMMVSSDATAGGARLRLPGSGNLPPT